ncbi:MAG: RMD1 family protein [Deltaproteobacteria bacterium]|nr:RMD1 family protein [Deltaproteobacteria bacterium]MBI3293678.1 RMD1 family protein [Deltaproteobacteria bacterium]
MSSYALNAYNLYDSIRLKSIRNILAGKIIHTAPHEVQLQYGDNNYLFVYRFGCLVSFNMPKEDVDRETEKLRAALGNAIPEPTTESFTMTETEGSTRVEYDYAASRKLTLDLIRLTALTLGQSAALEYFEIRAERMLHETSNLMGNLAKVGAVPFGNKRLLKIIGSTASTRQNIISNVSILDPPEETWKSKELGKFFEELQNNFDIALRFRTLDRKLTLVQDNIEIMADLTTSRRTIFVEALIVLLIVMELATALFR